MSTSASARDPQHRRDRGDGFDDVQRAVDARQLLVMLHEHADARRAQEADAEQSTAMR
jgi:hypothetical protein